MNGPQIYAKGSASLLYKRLGWSQVVSDFSVIFRATWLWLLCALFSWNWFILVFHKNSWNFMNFWWNISAALPDNAYVSEQVVLFYLHNLIFLTRIVPCIYCWFCHGYVGDFFTTFLSEKYCWCCNFISKSFKKLRLFIVAVLLFKNKKFILNSSRNQGYIMICNEWIEY